MNSIRRYLLRALVLSLVAGSLLTAGLVFWNATDEIDELYDKNMQEVALLLLNEIQGNVFNKVLHAERLATRLKGEEEMLIQVWQHRKLVYSSYPNIAFPLQRSTGQFTDHFQGEPWHIYRTGNEGETIIQLAQPFSSRTTFVHEMAWHMLYPMLGQIPLIGLFIWLAVGKSLRPLSQLSRAIRGRSAHSLAPFDPSHVPQEVMPLVQELNGLLSRVDNAMNSQKQFTADAAHELRTPLAAVKLQLANMERAKTPSEEKQALHKLHDGVDRASHVVQQLLTLARLEPESHAREYGEVDLVELARKAVEAHAELAFAAGLDLGLARAEEACVYGNADRLRILLDNLIENAVRYTRKGGEIDIVVYRDGAEAVLEVRDTGIGIAPAERTRIFERFYRVLGTETNGTGLGLAIVQHVVNEHRGTITIVPGANDNGSWFVVRLPVA